MAITQTGAVLQFSGVTGSRTGSFSVDVPADAQFVLVGISAYSGSGLFADGALTFTKGGIDTAMTLLPPGTQDNTPGAYQAGLFYLVLPDTGTGKTLKYSFLNAPGECLVSVTFWNGIDTGNPIRDSGWGNNTSSLPYSTSALASQAGDLLVGWCAGYVASGTPDLSSCSANVTILANVTNTSTGDGAWLSGVATGSGQIVSALSTTNGTWEDGSIIAVALIPGVVAKPLIDAVSDTDAGFSGTPDNTSPFTSGQAVAYQVQSGLPPGTYFWRVRAKDPAGSNSYGAWSEVRQFTVSAGSGGTTWPL